MDVGLRSQDGAVGLPRPMPASPDTLRKALAPFRDARGSAVAGLWTWDGLAGLGAWATPGRDQRALGARRATVLSIVLVESCALAVAGGVGGILGGHAIAYIAGSLLARGGLVTNPFLFDAREPAVLASVILLGALAGLLPAVLAYRTEVAENLAPLS